MKVAMFLTQKIVDCQTVRLMATPQHNIAADNDLSQESLVSQRTIEVSASIGDGLGGSAKASAQVSNSVSVEGSTMINDFQRVDNKSILDSSSNGDGLSGSAEESAQVSNSVSEDGSTMIAGV